MWENPINRSRFCQAIVIRGSTSKNMHNFAPSDSTATLLVTSFPRLRGYRSFLYTLVVMLYLFHTIYLADLHFFQAWAYSVYDNDYHEGNHKLLIGGDFNVALQPAVDCLGGNTTLKESVKFLEDIFMEHDKKIRQESIRYSKSKARERKAKMKKIEDTLKVREELIAEAPTPENLAILEAIKMENEREFDYIMRLNNSLTSYLVRTRRKKYKIFSKFRK